MFAQWFQKLAAGLIWILLVGPLSCAYLLLKKNQQEGFMPSKPLNPEVPW